MVDVDCAVGSTPCLTPADDRGYEIDEADVAYWGRCPECVEASRAASHADPSRRRQRRNASAKPPTSPPTDGKRIPRSSSRPARRSIEANDT
jgi:Fur family ferric uptake transcriptional regulator